MKNYFYSFKILSCFRNIEVYFTHCDLKSEKHWTMEDEHQRLHSKSMFLLIFPSNIFSFVTIKYPHQQQQNWKPCNPGCFQDCQHESLAYIIPSKGGCSWNVRITESQDMLSWKRSWRINSRTPSICTVPTEGYQQFSQNNKSCRVFKAQDERGVHVIRAISNTV